MSGYTVILPVGEQFVLVDQHREPVAASRDLAAVHAAARLLNLPVETGANGNLLHELPSDWFGTVLVAIPSLSHYAAQAA